MSKLSIKGGRSVKMYAFLAVFAAFAAVPFFGLASHHEQLYVNAKASGMEDGSREHPYAKIGSAIDKADSNAEIHVSKGEYDENITLKKGIKLFGDDASNTTIKAKKDKWATVYMKDNSEIDDFSIKGGNNGIYIENHAKVNIISCSVRYNDGDGISVKGDGTTKSNQVYIGDTEVRDNGRAGIYVSGPRRVTVMNSDIFDNQTDGIDLANGVSAYLEGNSLKNNGGSGLVLTLDGADIWTKKNSIRGNSRAGVEVSDFGGTGRIDIAKSSIVGNGRYGVTRLQKSGTISSATWSNDLTFGSGNYFATNGWGNISNILRVN